MATDREEKIAGKIEEALNTQDTSEAPGGAAPQPTGQAAQEPAAPAAKTDKPQKPRVKVRHTSLVVPGTSAGGKRTGGKTTKKTQTKRKTPDRLGRKPAPKPAEPDDPTLQEYGFGGKDNTIVMRRKNPARKKVRRKRNWKRIRNVIILVAIIWVIAFFATGTYLSAWVVISEAADNARIALQSGAGFPMDFAMLGYKDAQPMEGAFAVLGEKDFAVVSSTGRELHRIQHNMVNPYITTGNNRVCVYDRGGKTYRVEGKTDTDFEGTADKEIFFAQMSPGGWLALCTGSRSRYEVTVYSPTMTGEHKMRWTSSYDIPLRVAFHTDDKTMAIGCLTSDAGTMDATVIILRTDRQPERAELARITVPGAVPVQLHFLSAGRLLVVYNTGMAAVYNTSGAEVARYDYTGRSLYAADTVGGNTALLLGATGQDSAYLVLLDSQLRTIAEAEVDALGAMQVLAASDGAYLLNGQEVQALNTRGEWSGVHILAGRAYGLTTNGKGTPLVLSAGSVEDINYLLHPQAPEETGASGGSAASAAPGSAAGSTPPLVSAPPAAPEGDDEPGDTTSAPPGDTPQQ